MPALSYQLVVAVVLLPLLMVLIAFSFLFPKVFLSEEMVTWLFMLTTITVGIVIARPGLLTPIKRKTPAKGPAVAVLPGPQVVVLRGKPQADAPKAPGLGLRLEDLDERYKQSPAIQRAYAVQARNVQIAEKKNERAKVYKPRRPLSLSEQAAQQSPNMTLIWGLAGFLPALFFMMFIISQLPASHGEMPMSFYGVAFLGAMLLGACWAAVVPSPKQRQIARLVKQREREKAARAKQLAKEEAIAKQKAEEQAKVQAAQAQALAAQQQAQLQGQPGAQTVGADGTMLTAEEMGADEIEIAEGESLEDIKSRLKPKKPKIPLEMLNTANSYDDKVALIRFLVSEDSGRVMKAFQQMVKPTN